VDEEEDAGWEGSFGVAVWSEPKFEHDLDRMAQSRAFARVQSSEVDKVLDPIRERMGV
jgi:hypothetical protein